MSIALMRNIGAFVSPKFGGDHYEVVAGGGADGVAQNGDAVDRQGHLSCNVAVPMTAVLASSETASTVVQMQDSADGSTGWADYGDPSAAKLMTDAVNESDILDFDVDLSGAKAFIRTEITTTCSAGVTDTVQVMNVVTLGPKDENPAV